VSDDGGIIKIHYHKMRADLDDDAWEALASCDIDGSGSITLSEILSMSNRNKRLRYVVLACVIAIFILLGCMFCVSWAAAVLAQQTDVSDGSAMTAKGSSNIVSTAEAKESVPAAFASLLSREQLGRVKELTLVKLMEVVTTDSLRPTNGISNATEAAMAAALQEEFGYSEESEALTTVGCPTCPETLVTQVKAVQHYNATYIEFICEAGITVAMDHGEIHVFNLPRQPANSTFRACGSAECSSISLDGVDVPAMKKKASQLGFVDTAGARRSSGANSCKTMNAYCSGTGYCRTFSGCMSMSGGIGDKTYFNSTLPDVPLTVQMRLYPQGPLPYVYSKYNFFPKLNVNGNTKNAYANFVDGCAIRYGGTSVSATFGGWPRTSFQGPVAGYKTDSNGDVSSLRSGTITDDVTGGTMKIQYVGASLKVEVKDASGKWLAEMRCVRAYIGLKVDADLFTDNTKGIAGTGTASTDFTPVGPSPIISQKEERSPTNPGGCTPMSAVAGQCCRWSPWRRMGSMFDGYSNESPITKWQDTWMVQQDDSLFVYDSEDGAATQWGWWNALRSGVPTPRDPRGYYCKQDSVTGGGIRI